MDGYTTARVGTFDQESKIVTVRWLADYVKTVAFGKVAGIAFETVVPRAAFVFDGVTHCPRASTAADLKPNEGDVGSVWNCGGCG